MRGQQYEGQSPRAPRLGGLGERRKLPSGVRGEAPAANAFETYLMQIHYFFRRADVNFYKSITQAEQTQKSLKSDFK